MDMEFISGKMKIDMKVHAKIIVEKVKEHGFGESKVHLWAIDILVNGI
jgi:hypothetical protein